jgi:multiple sugar transport system substrate-binding protein
MVEEAHSRVTAGAARPALTRRRLGAAASTAAIALLGACAPGGAGQGAGEVTKTRQPVTLQWQSSTASGDQTRQKNWDLLLDRFQERQPHITVERAYLPSGEHYDKVVVGLAGGSMPDLFNSIVTRVPSWAARGVTLPLDEIVRRAKFNLADFSAQALDGCRFKDRLCFLPQQDSFYILLYNKDLFDKAGVPYPGTTLKWEDLPAAAKKMTRDTNGDGKLDEWGFYAPSGDKQWISALWINGAHYMDERATTSLIDRPEAVAAVQSYVDLWARHQVAPAPSDLNVSANAAWLTGKLGMYMQLNAYFGQFREGAQFAWDVALLPEGKGGRGTPRETSPFGIGALTRHPDEAWQVLDYMTSLEVQQHYSAAMGQWPTRKAAQDDYVKSYPKDQPPAGIGAVLEMERKNYARLWPVTTTWIDIATEWGNAMAPVYRGEASVAQAHTQLKTQFDRLLEEHQRLIR